MPHSNFTYLKFTKNNTPSNLFCIKCKSGFLSQRKKKNHFCSKKKYSSGRYRCLKCHFETENRNSILDHSMLCKVDNNLETYQIIERKMTCENGDLLKICPYCSRGFSSYTNFRENHIKECALNVNRKKCETSEFECKFCGKCYLLKTAAISHVHSHHGNEIRGGAESENSNKKSKSESFRYYKKVIMLNLDELRENEISDKIYEETIDFVVEKTGEDALKAYPIFKLVVVKKRGHPDETTFFMYFSVETSRIYRENYNSIIFHWVSSGIRKFEESTHLGSSIELVEISSVTILYFQYKGKFGKGNEKKSVLPVIFFQQNRIVKIINVPSGNINCFHICLCAAVYINSIRSEGRSPFIMKTTRKLRKEIGSALIDYNLLNLDLFEPIINHMPMKLDNISKIEKYIIKPYSLNVYELREIKEKQNKRQSQCGFEILPIFISNNHGDDENYVINMLFYKDHFYLINKFNSLIEKINGVRLFHSKFCYNCLNKFDERVTNLKEHLTYCKKGIKSHISYPHEGEQKKFTRFDMTLLSPYFAYCDFESTMLPVNENIQLQTPIVNQTQLDTSQNSQLNSEGSPTPSTPAVEVISHTPNCTLTQKTPSAAEPLLASAPHPPPNGATKEKCESKTTKLKKHSVNSVCCILYIEEKLFNFPYKIMEPLRYYYDVVTNDTRDECRRLISEFIQHLRNCSRIFSEWTSNIDSDMQLVELKQIHYHEFEKEISCMFCSRDFSDTVIKVFHHDHLRNKYIGASCSICNIKATKTKHLDVFFHNVSYDANFILENINFTDQDEQKEWRASLRGQKLQLMTSKSLKFRDSYALLPLGLAELGKILKPSECLYQNKYLPYADTGKGIFCYNYISSIDKFKETIFPAYENFFSNFGKEITVKDYNSAKVFYEKHFANLGEYNKFYITKDCLVGIDVLINMRDYLFTITGLDLLSSYSLPDLALNSLLFYLLKINKKLPLISNPDMYNAFLSGTKGGISWASLRHCHIEESRRFQDHMYYFDLKSSYPFAFTFPLPIDGYEYLDFKSPQDLISFVQKMDTTKIGFLCKIDCFSPKVTHDYLNDLPPIITKTSFSKDKYPNYSAYKSNSNLPRLIGHMGPSYEHVCTSQELLLMLSLGVEVTKVYSVIKYNVESFARELIEKLSYERQKAISEGNQAKAFVLKILLNALFGKCLLDKLKYHNTTIVFNRMQLENRVRTSRFKRAHVQENMGVVISSQKRIHLNSLVQLGCNILATSKVVLINYHYSLKKYFETITYLHPKPIFRSGYFDTDSMIIAIFNVPQNELFRIFKTEFSYMFDFSNLDKSHPLYSEENKFKIGVLKDETEGFSIQEFNGLGSKTYNLVFYKIQYLITDSERYENKKDKYIKDFNRCKGIPTRISSKFTSENFRISNSHIEADSCNANLSLATNVQYFGVQVNPGLFTNAKLDITDNFDNKFRETYTYSVKRKVLNPFDKKRFVIFNGYDSLSHNHFRIENFLKNEKNQ